MFNHWLNFKQEQSQQTEQEKEKEMWRKMYYKA